MRPALTRPGFGEHRNTLRFLRSPRTHSHMLRYMDCGTATTATTKRQNRQSPAHRFNECNRHISCHRDGRCDRHIPLVAVTMDLTEHSAISVRPGAARTVCEPHGHLVCRACCDERGCRSCVNWSQRSNFAGPLLLPRQLGIRSRYALLIAGPPIGHFTAVCHPCEKSITLWARARGDGAWN